MHQCLRIMLGAIAMHEHVRAGCMQPAANRCADATCAAGNQRDLVLQ
jgi:hypothetical protein